MRYKSLFQKTVIASSVMSAGVVGFFRGLNKVECKPLHGLHRSMENNFKFQWQCTLYDHYHLGNDISCHSNLRLHH